MKVPITGAVTAITTIMIAPADETDLIDQPRSFSQKGINRPRLFRAVITMLSIRNRAPTIIQPRVVWSGGLIFCGWSLKRVELSTGKWNFSVLYFVT